VNQTERLVRYLRDNPGASSLEITLACDIVNVTGRVSDARAQGVDIVCKRRRDGRQGYRVIEPDPVQAALFFGDVA
jgi:hypothetical protein